jgi:Putative peptidoglycan binding domain/LysM domain
VKNTSESKSKEGGGDYTVRQGDCIESIALRHGLSWEKIWEHQKNSDIKEKRKAPNVLYPGDMVFLPDRVIKEESVSAEQRHRFKRKGVPSHLRLILRDEEDKPRANEPYVLNIDGRLFDGTTGDDGKVDHPIPPGARRAILRMEGEHEEYSFDLGYIDPLAEISGVQTRLNNLGFDCGPVNGVLNDQTREAIQGFQQKHDLKVTGKMDRPTLDKLEKVYGC